jgi:SAM-dependent methyltransferase
MSDSPETRHAIRASSFGALAADYETHRPDYPVEAVRWALEPLAGTAAPKVLDLAAGTGKLTRVLLAAGLDVVAVEPDPGMLAELRRGLPGVPAHAGRAEEIPLPDASVDAVLVGQAIHWFDKDRAFPEIARVLRPGGVLAGLWNADDHAVEWVAGLAKAARRDEVHILRAAEEIGDEARPPFGPAEGRLFDHAQRRTADSLTATIATHSHVSVLPEAERAELLAEVRAYLGSLPHTAEGEFDLPLVTLVQRRTLPPRG